MERDGKIIDDKQPQTIKKMRRVYTGSRRAESMRQREKRRLNQGLTEKENDLWKVLTFMS